MSSTWWGAFVRCYFDVFLHPVFIHICTYTKEKRKKKKEKLEERGGLDTLVRPYCIQLLPHEIAAAAAQVRRVP